MPLVPFKKAAHLYTVFLVQSMFHRFCMSFGSLHAISIPCHKGNDIFVPVDWSTALNPHWRVQTAEGNGLLFRWVGEKMIVTRRTMLTTGGAQKKVNVDSITPLKKENKNFGFQVRKTSQLSMRISHPKWSSVLPKR